MSDPQHTPALSVVMPAYNAERYIERAIQSILSQTLTDLELVVVDDCSTDSTWEIIQSFAAADPRVRTGRNETNSGPAATVNHAIRLSRAPIIAGMDSDDISVPNRMERQIELLRSNPALAVVGSFASHINEHDEILSLSRTGPTSISEFEDLKRRGEPTMVFGGTAMYTRELYDKVGGFDSSLRAAGDIEFCDRMGEHGAIVAIPEALLLYRIHASSVVMRRFREGRRTHRYLAARRLARLAGDRLPTRAEFVTDETSAPWWRRVNIWRDDYMQYFYRQAGLAFGQGRRVQTGLYLSLAAAIGPLHVIRRLWDQRLSSEARQTRIDLGDLNDD